MSDTQGNMSSTVPNSKAVGVKEESFQTKLKRGFSACELQHQNGSKTENMRDILCESLDKNIRIMCCIRPLTDLVQHPFLTTSRHGWPPPHSQNRPFEDREHK